MAAQSSATPFSASNIRNFADFHPSLWGNHFLESTFQTTDDTTKEQHEKLKEEVRRMITATTTASQKEVLRLIDTVQRLGVAYHFEKEIEDALDKVVHDLAENYHSDSDDDLYTVSLRFRLLRQHGIMISCDVFNKFKDEKSKFFKESLKKDVEGMLSLYEAGHLAIHGEEILDEAISFTSYLKSLVPDHDHVSSNLAQQINHALYCPIRKAVPRIQARYFFDIYARDDLHNQTLLEFAKLDFNILQAEHQKELSGLTRWWRDLECSTKLQYARDRLVELYFWILGVYFEPKYALSRIILTKVICITSVMDDTFDAYGTFEELQLFTDAVKRWNIDAIDVLPEYMKIIYKTLLNIYNEIEEELTKEGKSHCFVHYAKEKMQELTEVQFAQAKWLNEGYVPTMEEYNSIALRSSGIPMLVTNSFLGMGDFATEDAFKWVFTNPKIIKAASIIGRISDDIQSHEFEQRRGHIASAVECYMSQFGASEEEAVEVLRQEVANAWKDINQEYFLIINDNNKPTAVSFPLLERILNLSRTCNFIYKDGDRYTNSHLMKNQVASLLKDPVFVVI